MIQPDLAGASRLNFEEEIGVDQDPDDLKALESSDFCKARPAVRCTAMRSTTSQGAKPSASDRQTHSVVSTPRIATKRKRD